MDESTILQALTEKAHTAKLAGEMPVRVEQAPTVEQPQPISKPTEYPTDIGALRLVDHFNIPKEARADRDVMDRLNKVFQWVSKQIQSHDSLDVLNKLHEIEGTLGISLNQDNLFEKVYRYLSLDQERRRVEQEMQV